MLLTVPDALLYTARIAAAGIALGSLELLWSARSIFARGILPHHAQPAFLSLAILRLAAAGLLLIGPSAPAAATVLLTSLALYLRNPWGQAAADQMHILTFAGLTAAWLTPDPWLAKAALWFIALQSALSYVTAGWHKLATAEWRDGTAIAHTFNTRSYGLEWVSNLLHARPTLAPFIAWPVIVWECAFPLAFTSPDMALAVTTAGVGFHAGTAAVIKLNNFLFAFPATYPAVITCAGLLA